MIPEEAVQAPPAEGCDEAQAAQIRRVSELIQERLIAPAQRPRDEGDRVVYMGLAASPSRQHYWAVYHVDLTDVSLRRWEWAVRTHFERHKLDNLPPSLTTHDRQIIGRVLQSSVMLSESGYKGNRAEVGSEPPATWHLGLLPAAPTKLTTKPGLAQGS